MRCVWVRANRNWLGGHGVQMRSDGDFERHLDEESDEKWSDLGPVPEDVANRSY